MRFVALLKIVRITLVLGVLFWVSRSAYGALPPAFVDLSGTAYDEAIRYVASQGIVEGYWVDAPLGKARAFKPLNKINRAEFTKMIIQFRFDEATIQSCTEVSFSDVPRDSWFAPYVCVAKKNNIIGGYPDKTFRPSSEIAFVEAAKIMVKAFDFPVENETAPWYRGYLNVLEEKQAIPQTVSRFDRSIDRAEVAEILYRLMIRKTDLPSLTEEQIKSLGKLRRARILDYPLPENLFCLDKKNQDQPSCARYYEKPCPDCDPAFRCGDIVNPVCGVDGKSYPNACFARLSEVAVGERGLCPSTVQFMSDLWRTKKFLYDHTEVPSPHVSFVFSNERSNTLTLDPNYVDSNRSGFWLQSILAEGAKKFRELHFNISTTHFGTELRNKVTSHGLQTNPLSPSGKAKMLIVYIRFADFLSDEDLLEWTGKLGKEFNGYLRKEQGIDPPLQFEITPVVIDPPKGVTYQDLAATYRDGGRAMRDEVAVYDAALKKVKQKRDDFDQLVFAFITRESSGGIKANAGAWSNVLYKGHLFNLGFIRASISRPPIPPQVMGFDETRLPEQEKRLRDLQEFHDFFKTLSHELLHNLGWNSDHVPNSTDETKPEVDFETGEIIPQNYTAYTACEFQDFPHHYYIQLQEDLAIKVGEEPDWLSPNPGGCAQFFQSALRDIDGDRWYEMRAEFEPITEQMRASFGWADIDGDGVAEFRDNTPYGGAVHFNWQSPRVEDYNSSAPEGYYQSPVIAGERKKETAMIFTPLGPESHDGCLFEKIRLEDGLAGLLPLRCQAFNDSVVNVYRNVSYYWYFIKRDYGTVLLPRTL